MTHSHTLLMGKEGIGGLGEKNGTIFSPPTLSDTSEIQSQNVQG